MSDRKTSARSLFVPSEFRKLPLSTRTTIAAMTVVVLFGSLFVLTAASPFGPIPVAVLSVTITIVTVLLYWTAVLRLRDGDNPKSGGER